MAGLTPLDAALAYAARGWHVFPVQERGKAPHACLGSEGGHKHATTDEATIRAWWASHPGAGVGISAEPSGLVILDVDVAGGKGGDASLDGINDQLEPTLMARTGSGGLHAYYLRPPGVPASRKIRFLPGLDLIGKGYVVAPPSGHASGGCYEWLGGPSQVTPLPPVLRAHAGAQSAAVQVGGIDPELDLGPAPSALLDAARRRLLAHGPSVSGQGGDQHAYAAAAILAHDYALRPEEAHALLLEWNAAFRENHWSDDALLTKLRNASRYAAGARGASRARWEMAEAVGRVALSRAPERPRAVVDPADAPAVTNQPSAVSRLEDVAARPRPPVRTYPTKVPALNDLLGGGAKTRQLLIVAAPPADGKSALAVDFTIEFELAGLPTLYVSTELESDELLARYAGDVLGVAWTDIVGGKVDPARVRAAVARRRIYVVGAEDVPLDGDQALALVGQRASEVAAREGVMPHVVIDYMQDMARGGDEAGVRGRVGRIATMCRAMSQELDCPVWAVSSVSRAYYGAAKAAAMRDSDDARIYLAAAKESGDVDFAAATVLFLDVGPPGDAGERDARIAVAKCRHGRTGFVGAVFDGATGRWRADESAIGRLTGGVDGGKRAQERDSEDDARVLERASRFALAGAPQVKSALREACGMKAQRADAAVSRLLASGKLELRDHVRVDAYHRAQRARVLVPADVSVPGHPVVAPATAPAEAPDPAISAWTGTARER